MSKILVAYLITIFLLNSSNLRAEESSQPYIDSLKQRFNNAGKPNDAGAESYTEAERRKLKAQPAPEQSYIDQLKEQHPERYAPNSDSPFTEGEKSKLAPKETGGAIQALKEGRSELHAKRDEKPITSGIGLRIGAGVARTITVNDSTTATARDFSSVYTGADPEIALVFEWHPFHSETYGNLNVFGSLGATFANGFGIFQFAPLKPDDTRFDSISRTAFQFFTVPITVGLGYRFNLAKYIRPYVNVGPTIIGYDEMRKDGNPSHTGYSYAFTAEAGAAILLDWVSSSASWDFYEEYKIKHYYLTLAYGNQATFASDVNFNYSGLYAGILFEF